MLCPLGWGLFVHSQVLQGCDELLGTSLWGQRLLLFPDVPPCVDWAAKSPLRFGVTFFFVALCARRIDSKYESVRAEKVGSGGCFGAAFACIKAHVGLWSS